MLEKYTIQELTEIKVNVSRQAFAEFEGREYPIGEPWFRGYVNTIHGREQIIAELPLAQQNAIFSVWGDTPTVTENSDI